MPSGTLSEYIEKRAITITPSARYELVGRLSTNHVQQTFIYHHVTRLRALLSGSIIVRQCLHVVIFVPNTYLVHSENVIHGDLHPVCTVLSL